MRSSNLFLPGIRETIREGCRFVPFEKTELLPASLGKDANLIGPQWSGIIGSVQPWSIRLNRNKRRQWALMGRSKYMIVLVFLVFLLCLC